MNTVPSDIDFKASATASAVRSRGAVPITTTTQSSDVSVALYCVGVFDGYSTDEDLVSLESEEVAAPLIAAARTLISVSEELRGAEFNNYEIADGLAMHAAIAFAMHGNFPSAKTTMLSVSAGYRSMTASRRLAWAICDPSAIESIIGLADGNTEEAVFYRSWKSTLLTATDTLRDKSEELLSKFTVSPSDSDTALMLSAEVALRQSFRLAIAQLNAGATKLPTGFVDRLIQSGRFTLLPPQRKLLIDEGLAHSTRNALLNLPTSTGKTLLAEACIAATLAESPGIAVYVAPYIAIGDQVLTALRSHMPEDVQIVPMFGGFKAEFPSANPNSKQILVATPERFDGWLRTTEERTLLRLVILDELHCIENGARGARMEGTISRLRLMQNATPTFRLVCLSAVLAEAQGLKNWLAVSTSDFHRESWRPTARRLALCNPKGEMHWIFAADALRPKDVNFGAPISHTVTISLPEVIVPFKGRFVPDRESIAEGRNISAIARDLAKRLDGPGLIVCPRRKDTRRIAAALAETVTSSVRSTENLKIIAARIEHSHAWLTGLASMVRCGVAYHNATLPFDVRRWIEDAVRSGDIVFVASTTTLAEGADLPFRWTLVSHWLRGLYADAPPINPLTFRNIAGRSGRAGSYSEGDTVLYESLLGPTRPLLANPRERTAAITKILTDNSPLDSSISSAEFDGDSREDQAVIAAFSSQLMASIPENPMSEDIATTLAGASYAAQSGQLERVTLLFNTALEEMLSTTEPGGALAIRNSPIRLTEAGVAANRSGFSPKTVRQIIAFVSALETSTSPASLVADALCQFASVPEQTNAELIKICTQDKHKIFLKKDDLASVIGSWLSGIKTREIFEALPTFKKTSSNTDTKEAQFEIFVGFADSVLGTFAPWLLRAMDTLKQFGNETSQSFEWHTLSEMLENPQQSSFSGEAD